MVKDGEVFVQFVAPAPKVSATPSLPPPANSPAATGRH
jgi:cell division protein FtsB